MKINNFVAKHNHHKGGVHDKDNRATKHKRERRNAKNQLRKGNW